MAKNVYQQESSAFTLVAAGTGGAISSGFSYQMATWDNRLGTPANGPAFYANVEINCGFSASPGGVAYLILLMLPSIDNGANFPVYAAQTFQYCHQRGKFHVVLNQTSPQRLTLEMIPVQPVYYACFIYNATGVTLAANWSCILVPVNGRY